MRNTTAPDPQILAIEDNPADAMLLRDMLRESGVNAAMHHVADGEQALGYLRSASLLPEVITLDINLPRLGGAALIAEIRAMERCADLPLFVLSGSAAPNDVALGALPNVTYFQKPDDISEYLQLASLIRQHLSSDRIPHAQE